MRRTGRLVGIALLGLLAGCVSVAVAPPATPTAPRATASAGMRPTTAPRPAVTSAPMSTPMPGAVVGHGASPAPGMAIVPENGPVPPVDDQPAPPIGQRDLGAGLPATSVPLRTSRLLRARDGALYLVSGESAYGRIWRLDGGTLRPVAGRGRMDAEGLTGLAATDAGLGWIVGLTQDDRGRLVLIDRAFDGLKARLSRLEPDGTMKELWRSEREEGYLPMPASGDAVRFLAGTSDEKAWSVFETTGAGEPTKLGPVDAGAARHLRSHAGIAGHDGQGGAVVVDGDWSTSSTAYALDPATWAPTPIATAALGGRGGMGVDAWGNVLVELPDGTITATTPGGTTSTLLGPGPYRGLGDQTAAVALGADGEAWLKDWRNRLVHVQQGATAIVAGTDLDPQPAGGAPVFAAPNAVAVAGGAIFVGDVSSVVRVNADGTADPYVARPSSAAHAIHRADYQYDVRDLQADAAGNLYFLDAGPDNIWKVPPGGPPAIIHDPEPGASISHLAVAPDGTVVYARAIDGSNPGIFDRGLRFYRLGDQEAMPLHETGEFPLVAAGPDGTFRFLGHDGLVTWSAAKGTSEPVRVALPDAGRLTGLAVDAKGRVYAASGTDHRVWRLDPAARTLSIFAGVGGSRLNGRSVDTGLGAPAGMAFDANGDLLIADSQLQQVKRIRADRL